MRGENTEIGEAVLGIEFGDVLVEEREGLVGNGILPETYHFPAW